jgi:hypothetical protein
MVIRRELTKKGYSFKFTNDNNYIGFAKYTHLILPDDMTVQYGSKTLQIKQESYILKFINSLPLLNIETFTPHYLYIDGEKVAKITHRFFRPISDFEIDGHMYSITQKNNNVIYVMKDGNMVARYKKRYVTYREENTYDVDDNILISKELVLLFCVFIDVVLFRSEGSYSYVKYERDFVLFGGKE